MSKLLTIKIVAFSFLMLIVFGCRPDSQNFEQGLQKDESDTPQEENTFQIETSKDAVSQTNGITFEDVQKAYETIIALESRVQNLPDTIEAEEVEKIQEEYRGVLWEASKVARSFWSANPEADEFLKARDYEKRWVTVLASFGHKLAEQRLSELVIEDLSDPTIASDEKYQIYVQAVQQAALRERENGVLAMSRKLESGTDQLMEKFPTKAKSIELYFMPLKAFHVYKQTNDFVNISEKIQKEIGRLETNKSTLEDAAKVRLDYAAALFELRVEGQVLNNLEHVLALDIPQSIKADAQMAIQTVKDVLKAEVEQDKLVGQVLNFQYSLRDPKSGTNKSVDLASLGNKANVLFFLSEVDIPTVQVLKDLLATVNNFKPDPIGIVYVPLRTLTDSEGENEKSLEELASFLPSEAFVKKIDDLNESNPWLTIDVSEKENLDQLKSMYVKIHPQLWLLDQSGKVNQVRASQKIQVHLFNLLRTQGAPVGAGSIFEQ